MYYRNRIQLDPAKCTSQHEHLTFAHRKPINGCKGGRLKEDLGLLGETFFSSKNLASTVMPTKKWSGKCFWHLSECFNRRFPAHNSSPTCFDHWAMINCNWQKLSERICVCCQLDTIWLLGWNAVNSHFYFLFTTKKLTDILGWVDPILDEWMP